MYDEFRLMNYLVDTIGDNDLVQKLWLDPIYGFKSDKSLKNWIKIILLDKNTENFYKILKEHFGLDET